ncbi:MAG: AsmA-like C-terminal region-containing protein [Bacteroidota bacterium]
MKKAIKIIGVVLLLMIALMLTAPFIFKDKLVALVKEEANKNLNAKVDFGVFDLTIIKSFPHFTFSIDQVSVVGINEFENDTLLSLGNLELKMDLMSVIKGDHIKIQSIVLNTPRIQALVSKNGKANWDITKPSNDSATTSEQPSKFQLSLKKFAINNGYLLYDDQQANMRAELAGLNHELQGDFTQDNFLMNTITKIASLDVAEGGVRYFKHVETEIKADLEMDMKASKYTFKENEFRLNALVFGLDGFVAMPKEDIDMDIKFLAKKAAFKEFLSLIPGVYTKDFADVKTAGNLAFSGYAKGTYNDKMMPAFGLTLKVDNAMFQYPSLPKKVENINIDLSVSNNDGVPDHTITDIRKFHVEMAGNPIDVRMRIATPVSDANIDGTVKGKVDLNSMKDIIPMEKDEKLNGVITADVVLKGSMSAIEKEQYQDFNASGNMTIEGMQYQSKATPYGVNIKKASLDFTPKYLDLTAFDALLGKSDLQAKGKIENYMAYAMKDEMLKGNVSLSSNYFDLNQFMTDEPEGAAKPADTAAMTVAEIPANLDFTITAAFIKLIYDNMDISNVKGKLTMANSELRMQDVSMNLLDGSMILSGLYGTKNVKAPVIDFNMGIKNFDIPQTYKTFNTVQKIAGIAEYATGSFNCDISFSGMMDAHMNPVYQSLNGAGRLQTQNVVLSNYAPLNKVADAIKMDKYKRLSLNNTNLSFKFKDGGVDVEPFDIKAGDSKLTVQGRSNFDQTINFPLTFDIARSDFGGAANNMLNGLVAQANSKGTNFSLGERVQLSALLTGTAKNPVVKTNLKAAAGNMVDDLKNKAKEELDKKKAELEAKAQAELAKKKAEAEAALNKTKAEAEAKAKAEADKAKAEAERLKKEAEAKAKAEAEKAKKAAEEKAKKEAEKKLKGLFGK